MHVGRQRQLLFAASIALFSLRREQSPVLARRSGRVLDQTLLDICRDVVKCFRDVFIQFRAGFEELDGIFAGKGDAPILVHHALVLHVTLVANQNLVDAFCRVLLDVSYPVPYILERILVRDVVHEQYSHRAAVVSCGDGPEALLPRRVPDLQLDALAFDFNGFDLEIDPNRRNERSCEAVIAEPKQQA